MELEVPETVLPGSDFVELVSWCCFGLPGLVYCALRHLNRYKACVRCGSVALMREARASAARRLPDAPPLSGPRVRNVAGPVSWPPSLATPRVRLRKGAGGAILLSFALAAFGLGLVDLVSPRLAFGVMLGATGATLLWLSRRILELACRPARSLERCQAWDDEGRTLRIEPV
jgi:hypothetical protein